MLLPSWNWKYPPFPLFSYFSMAVCLRCLLHHIMSLIVYTFLENRESLFISIVQFMMSANSRIRFGLQIVFVCLYITPSSLCKLIWIHWIYKMPGRYNLSSVWVRLSIFSQLSIIQYVERCVFSLPIYFVMVERIYILCLIIIIKSEVGTITHCLELCHDTMVCAVCLSIFLLKKFAWYKRPCTSQLTYKAWFMEDFYRMKHPMTEVIILLADLHFLLSGLFIHEYLKRYFLSMSKLLMKCAANT